jgi:hypothetical protein
MNLLGVATSNLTFFRQIGGTVGLAIAGTIFGSSFRSQAPVQITNQLQAVGVDPATIAANIGKFNFAGGNVNNFVAVGSGGLNQQIAGLLTGQGVPANIQAVILQPIVDGLRAAFSLAIADSLWLAAGAAFAAAVVSVFMVEHPLRSAHNAQSAAVVQTQTAPLGDPAPPETA